VSAISQPLDLAAVDTALARYLSATSDVLIADDIGLHSANVGRRKLKILDGAADAELDAFTGRQVLRMAAADARRGGKLLDEIVRLCSPLAPSGNPDEALDVARQGIRRLLSTLESAVEATEDGELSPDEAEEVAARFRLLSIAVGAYLPHLDARAAQRGRKS